jgi:hypothetical protein
MKNNSWLQDSILVLGLATIMTIVLAHPVFSQDTVKKNPKTTMKISIIRDDNGKKTILDTTITSSRRLDPDEMDEIIAHLDDNIKGLDEGLKELDINLGRMKLPDSAMMDSLMAMTGHMKMMMRKFGSPHFGWHHSPGAFDYNFDFDLPEVPEPPEPPAPDGEYRHHFEYQVDPFEGYAPDAGRGNGSLMELLRGIPMNRIKSFNIKEMKDGTKITIEVGHEPVLGSRHLREETIIVHPDGSVSSGRHHDKGKTKTIIIKSDPEDNDKL